MTPLIPTEDVPRLRRIDETARLLSVAPSSVWAMIRDGRLKPVRIGSHCTRIADAELRSFIARTQAADTDPAPIHDTDSCDETA